MENKHINKELLRKYHTNQLSPTETNAILTHISECTYCADLFAESFLEHDRIISAPKNLKESILVEVSKKKHDSTKRQLFFYSMRVCTAMCGALFLLFSSFWKDAMITSAPVTFTESRTESFFDTINDSMSQFTYEINDKMNLFSTKQPTNHGGNIDD